VSRVRIKPGDLLLVEAESGFDTRWNQRRDEFYLVAPRRPERTKPQVGRAPLALGILAAVVLLAAFGVADIVTTAFIGALAMVATGCLSGQMARRAVNFQILIVIAAALGIGKAIDITGLAAAVAHLVVEHSPAFGTVGVLITVYIATSLMTEVITNNAAAALMVGVGLAAAAEIGAPPEAFALAVAIAASASFLTPIGYQTNLMVLAAGGYRFADFIKSGFLVTIIVGATAIMMISLVWL
jgi:di/tricarboxylate transporter